MFPPDPTSAEEAGVFTLLTGLCRAVASEVDVAAQPALVRKMRSRAYEVLLGKGLDPVATAQSTSPVSDLLGIYYVRSHEAQSVAEQSAVLDLYKCIETVREDRLCDTVNGFENTLRLLVGLRDEVPPDHSTEFLRPFTLGKLESMLPRPPRTDAAAPLPYQYYPAYLFRLPHSLARPDLPARRAISNNAHYKVESFHSKSCVSRPRSTADSRQLRLFEVPSSLAGDSTRSPSGASLYNDATIMLCPRLWAPRDLHIPTSDSGSKLSKNQASPELEEMFRATESKLSFDGSARREQTVDIWEVASSIDKNLPSNIWEIAAKLPSPSERRLIAMSAREVALWRDAGGAALPASDLVSEKQFIRNAMYLTIGIESRSFVWREGERSFCARSGLALEGVSSESVRGYVAALLSVGTCYRRLYTFAFPDVADELFHDNGYIYETARNVVKRYLLKFCLQATEMYERYSRGGGPGEQLGCLPTLLQVMFHMEPLKYEIETVASIYKVIDADPNARLPCGAGLMTYLYSEISLITHARTASTMFSALYSICKVYFKFIERFIFQGELADRHDEFFIRKDLQNVHSQSKRYWDRGFYIGDTTAVPDFLRGLAKYILLCGKSFRLLKLCNPSDPLVILISSDHPSIKCCTSFAQISRQQELLELYRTRCLFVRGGPITFQQMMLKREADKKAFTEMASIKQAETLEKIVAERKRLAQLIIAEKQHNLRVLEAAIAETKASKNRIKTKGTLRTDLEKAVDSARDVADSIIREEEREKMLEYYSQLNLEVEKRKAHTEWKIKRLQLDPERMQLLSTEERNLKREKMELQHVSTDDGATISLYSIDQIHTVHDQNVDEVSSDVVMRDIGDDTPDALVSTETGDVMLLTSPSVTHCGTDNNKLDSQGNIVIPTVFVNETNVTFLKDNTSSDFDNNCLEAIKNRQKVLSHGHRQLDSENNVTHVTDVLRLDNRNTETKYAGCNQAFLEAQRNKHKVLGTGNDSISSQNSYSTGLLLETEKMANTVSSDAQTEAQRNKLNVLGADNDNILSQMSYSTEFLLESEKKLNIVSRDAQTEAQRNKVKVLGTYNDNISSQKSYSTGFLLESENLANIVSSDAQTEARRNKLKVLGTEDDNFNLKSKSQSTEQLDNFNVNVANAEARRNRLRALGTDNENPKEFNRSQSIDQLTGAHKEAFINKQKVLGTEYHLEKTTYSKEILNVAQEEAAKNKIKILSSEYGINLSNIAKADTSKRAVLTLDLKGSTATIQEKTILGITPTTGGLTPGDYLTQLDLETPTTAEVPFGGPPATSLSPPNRSESLFNSSKHNDFVSSEGFKFPSVMLEEDSSEIEVAAEYPISNSNEDSTTNSLSDLHLNKHFDCIKSSIWNLENKAYNFESFDPFGVKNATFDSKEYFSDKLTADMKKSCYTSPVDIMKEAQKKPYSDIFHCRSNLEEEPDNCVFENMNIATLTACFQRSVMLPLSYHLEMVNNAILTHYLVDLDMYEHLRSLKDYFFLMDGEFSRNICQNLFHKLVNTVNPEELLNFATLHSILDTALGSSITNMNKYSENLSFTISEPPMSFQLSSPDVLQCLSLSYAVSWPLNIILSAEALSRYSRLFQFLLKMRRVAWMLGQDFEVLKLSVKMSRGDSRSLLGSSQYNSVQLYRHIMAALVRALDSYIVTTCIQSTWTELEADLTKARTLDDLYDCHVVYVKKVLFRCLLNKRSAPVMKLLNDIFTVILRFSHVLRTRTWKKNEETGHFTNSCFAQLEELFHLFEKLTKHLHKTISRLMECGYQPHLAELLTMINLNGYYDSANKSQDTTGP